MVAGLEDITSGEITIGGRIVNNIEAKDRDIAMVFQNYALYPHMTVGANMAYGLKMRGLPRAEIAARVARAATTLQLDGLLDRKPRQLSGGQRQRVAMGRAIVRDPKVFLFDEPLSNLDAKLRGQMRVEIRRLQQSLGTTAIYVTHDQVEAMTLADRLIVMNAGVAEQVGTPLDLYERPATLFVAGFIGSPAMNFVAAVPAAEDSWLELDDDTRLRPPPDREPLPPGRRLILGIRPEHLTLAGGIAPLSVTVELVEMLGADTIVHGRLRNGTLLLARLPGSARTKPGERVPLGIDPARLHVFDQETGKRL
jgi:sn-glycerol 3-phosphate transport system ATP-binding protein